MSPGARGEARDGSGWQQANRDRRLGTGLEAGFSSLSSLSSSPGTAEVRCPGLCAQALG